MNPGLSILKGATGPPDINASFNLSTFPLHVKVLDQHAGRAVQIRMTREKPTPIGDLRLRLQDIADYFPT